MSGTTAIRPFHRPKASLSWVLVTRPSRRSERRLRVIKGARAVMHRSSFFRHQCFCEGFRGCFLLQYAHEARNDLEQTRIVLHLDRLLALKHQSYAEEVAQRLHNKGKDAKKPTKTTKRTQANEARSQGLLF